MALIRLCSNSQEHIHKPEHLGANHFLWEKHHLPAKSSLGGCSFFLKRKTKVLQIYKISVLLQVPSWDG